MSSGEYSNALSQLAAVAGGTPIRPTTIRPKVVLDDEAVTGIHQILERGELSDWRGGPKVREFEAHFARLHGMSGAVAVNSGTSALHCAFVAAGLTAGDEVLLPAAGFVSAASAVVQQRAIPVICDIDPMTNSLALDEVEKRVTERSKIIVPIHLWGIPSQMDSLIALARKYNLQVIEDCGQGHGAKYKERLVGSFGSFSAFSFAPGKLISTGQGGIVACETDDGEERVRRAANKGKGEGFLDYHAMGYSYAMTDIEASIGMAGLRRLEDEVARRRIVVEIYQSVLADSDLQFSYESPSMKSSYYKFPVRLPPGKRHLRDKIITAICAENVGARPTHPPMHQIPWIAVMLGSLQSRIPSSVLPRPNSEEILPAIIELETGPGMSENDGWASAVGVLRAYKYVCQQYQ